jgi:hypothetical protein
MQTDTLLDRWDIRHAAAVDWMPWGEGGKTRAKMLGEADGLNLTLVEAGAGYRGSAHEHAYAELLYLVAGRIRNQGQVMAAGDGYAAAAGSTHSDFEVLEAATYVLVWRI